MTILSEALKENFILANQTFSKKLMKRRGQVGIKLKDFIKEDNIKLSREEVKEFLQSFIDIKEGEEWAQVEDFP